MKCYICGKWIKIRNILGARKDEKGYAHENCFKAQSTLLLKPLDVEDFTPPLTSGNPKDVINNNVIGEFDG